MSAFGIANVQSADLVLATLPKLNKGKWTDTFKHQSYPFLERASNDANRTSSSGTSIEIRVRMRSGQSARGVELYEVTEPIQTRVMEKASMPWVLTEAKVNYDMRELAMNGQGDEQTIIDWLKAKRDAEIEDLANLWEEWAFLPPVSSTDFKNGLAGLPYWIAPLAAGVTDSAVGFNGVGVTYQNGSTSNLVGGIDASLPENERWRNCNGIISGMNMEAIDKARQLLTRVRFKPGPMMNKTGATNQRSRCSWFFSMQDKDEYVRITNQGSDPRRGDAAPFHGDEPMMHGIPIEVSDVLDGVTYLPIYFVNFKYLMVHALKNFWMKYHPAQKRDGNANVVTEQIDCAGNIFCTNRRAHGVLHRAY